MPSLCAIVLPMLLATDTQPLSVEALYDANRMHAIKSDAAWTDGGRFEDDIHLWRRNLGDHFEFRAIGTVQASMDKVLTIILDQNHGQQWMEGSVECFVIEEKSFGHFIGYNRNASPGPMIDGRDGCSEFTTSLFPESKAIRVDVEEVDDKRKPPRKGVVRMKLISGFWLLRAISDTQTEVTYQLAIDIGGNLPDFVVNLASRDVPAKTIKALRAQLDNPVFKPFHARVLKRIDWSTFGMNLSTASD